MTNICIIIYIILKQVFKSPRKPSCHGKILQYNMQTIEISLLDSDPALKYVTL